MPDAGDITRSVFRFYTEEYCGQEIMIIEDLKGGDIPVSKDLKNVLRDIVQTHLPRDPVGNESKLPARILLRRRNRVYDGIHALPDGTFVALYPIGTQHLDVALEKARSEL